MNPLVLLPLMALGCAAAPHGVVALHGAAVPYSGLVATHSVTHNVPSAVEYKQVGAVVPVAAHLPHVAVPGYTVGGEIRTVDTAIAPLVAHTGEVAHSGVYAHHGLIAHPGVYANQGLIAHHGLGYAPFGVAPAVVKSEAADDEDKTVAVHSYTLPTAYAGQVIGGVPALPHLGLGLGYHGLGLGLHGLPVVAAPAAEKSEE